MDGDTETKHGHAAVGGSMTPNNDLGINVWQMVDEIGYGHNIMIWMVILELEKEGAHPINTSTVERRLIKWTGEFPPKNQVGDSMRRLLGFGLIEREEVTEYPHGFHWTTTPTGIESARQLAIKWLRLLECEDRADLQEIEPETGTDASEAE